MPGSPYGYKTQGLLVFSQSLPSFFSRIEDSNVDKFQSTLNPKLCLGDGSDGKQPMTQGKKWGKEKDETLFFFFQESIFL